MATRPDEGALCLAIANDGAPWDLAADPQNPSLGLRIMRYRSELIHGALDISTTPSGRSRVECRLPLPARLPDWTPARPSHGRTVHRRTVTPSRRKKASRSSALRKMPLPPIRPAFRRAGFPEGRAPAGPVLGYRLTRLQLHSLASAPSIR
jgi:hypothetical protein